MPDRHAIRSAVSLTLPDAHLDSAAGAPGLNRDAGAPKASAADHRPMNFEHTRVFVLELARQPAFAFAADNIDMAQQLARSKWLLQALDAFCRTRRPADRRPADLGRLQLRDATRDEAAFYRDRADEFADTAPAFLVAHLPEI